MLAVIDESGCTGFKPGSSSHFVVGMIIFESFEDAQFAAQLIHNLRKTSGYKRKEYHFSACNIKNRDLFFGTILKAKFRVRLFVIEKRLIHSPALKKDDELFVNYCLKCLMKSGAEILSNAVVKIDGKGSKYFKRGCSAYLRKEMPEGKVKTIKFSDSESDVLIQLADMVVSAYARPYNNPTKEDAYRWRNMLEQKIENVWNFR